MTQIQNSSDPNENSWEKFVESIPENLSKLREELEEIELMIEQSQLEIEKLVHRNSSITAHLKQIQSNFDTMPRPDIRATYDAALESQQRLFVMRGQLEKFESDKQYLQRMIKLYDEILEYSSNGSNFVGKGSPVSNATIEKLEMIIQAQEAERLRLSQQMHDGPAQALSNFILQTEIAMRLFDVDSAKARDELGSLKEASTTTFQKVRDFIVELRPMMLDDLGLVPTLNRYVESIKEQSNVDIRLNIMGNEQRFESYLEVMLFRSIQELISTAIMYSRANQIKILLDISGSVIEVRVEDNGKGIAPELLQEREGMGLKIIKERVEMLGGEFTIQSSQGEGSRVHYSVPITKTFV